MSNLSKAKKKKVKKQSSRRSMRDRSSRDISKTVTLSEYKLDVTVEHGHNSPNHNKD